MTFPRRLAASLAAVIAISAGCGTAKKTASTTTTSDVSTTTTSTSPIGPPPQVKITSLGTFDHPTAIAQRTGDTSLYIAEKTGRVKTMNNGILNPTPVLDLSAEVSSGQEQGLLGIAFAPNSSKFYVDYTDTAGNTQIVEFTLGADGTADLHTKRVVMSVAQPYANHNGGQLAFGPDNDLYIGLGDGGSEGDPQKNGQNLTVLLGKILRINPTPSAGLGYTIPYDNPFLKTSGARGEIWAYGLRNPWRFSFDMNTGGIWIGDVGQDAWEEIDHQEKDPKGGQNYGWSLREGTHKKDGDKPSDGVDPIYEYTHSGGACSIAGGYAYRGSALPALTGRYVFGDYCTGQISVLTQKGNTWAADNLNIKLPNLSSFGQDQSGELYVLGLDGQLGRIDPA